jgi:dihydrolipoamide dehydrogenase
MMYDVAFIGGGPGGYVGAIRGGQLDAKICIIEAAELGGTCLNRGCIPSKAYYASASRMAMVADSDLFGINISSATFDLTACKKRKDSVVDELVGGVEKLLKGNNVDLVRGRGRFTASDTVEVTAADGTTSEVKARNFIIATGSRPMDIPSMPVDGTRIVNSDQIWQMDDLPESMVIVGGGVIGCELAHIFSAFGVKVTVVELLDRILFTEEKESGRAVAKKLKMHGVEFHTATKVESAEALADGAKVTLEGGKELLCDRVVVAVGRVPNTEGLGLKEAGVSVGERGHVKVNDEMETDVMGIYAVGDVVGRYMLAHVATSEAMVAIHNALGKKYWMDYDTVPRAIFTSPEVASVGLIEPQLKEEGTPYNVGRFSFAASGKALCMGEREGFIKLLSHKDTGRILGASIVGPHASDVIAEVALAMRMEASPGDIVTTIHVHPTISEVVLEASEDTMGLAIHKMGRKPVRK